MTEDWPRVVDGASMQARLTRIEKRLRRLWQALVLTAAALAVAGISTYVVVQEGAEGRQERFCALAEQAIVASTPEKPVDPFLITLHQASGCPDLLEPVVTGD